MAEKLVNIPIYILKNLRPHYLVGWLIRPEKVTRKPMSGEEKLFRSMLEAQKLLEEIEGPQAVRQEITKGKNKIVHGVGLVPINPEKPHLRLVAVDGKIIDPDFQ